MARFNEAALFRTRKDVMKTIFETRFAASMRPRSFERGKVHWANRHPRLKDRFNEAALFRTRKGWGGSKRQSKRMRFNEAALFRTRKA